MGKVIVMNGLTLDGVMQSPGRPDEDQRGGFEHGGWGVPYGDETMVATMGERLAGLTGGKHAWLFGRRTYEELFVLLEQPRGSVQGSAQQHSQARRLEQPRDAGTHLAFALNVLTVREDRVSDVTAFIVRATGAPGRETHQRLPEQPFEARTLAGTFQRFGLPDRWDA